MHFAAHRFCFAWQNRWLTEETIWLDMLEERNRTSHTYHEATAKAVFDNLPGYLPHLDGLRTTLAARIEEIKRSEKKDTEANDASGT